MSCASSWQRDQQRYAVNFNKLRCDEQSCTGHSSEPSQWLQIQCEAGWVSYFLNGQLEDCTLKKAWTYRTIDFSFTLDAGTYVQFDADGSLRLTALAHNQSFQGIECKGSGDGISGFHTTFHRNGALHWCFPVSDPITINDFSCRGGFWHGIALHDNGRLKQCLLAHPINYHGEVLRAGKELQLDALGQVIDDN